STEQDFGNAEAPRSPSPRLPSTPTSIAHHPANRTAGHRPAAEPGRPSLCYLIRETVREPQVMARLRAETRRLPAPSLQIGPEQAQLMSLLVRLIGARRALEIGTFTGYSALAVALALPADGSMICCDLSEEWTQVARRYWREAGIADRIELHLAPAADTLG